MAKTSSFKVVSETHGRIRLKSRLLYDPALDLRYLEAVLEVLPGVNAVRVNSRASSVAVEYDGDPDVRGRVLDLLENIPAEAYVPEGNGGEGPRLSGVVFKALAAAAMPLLPSPASAALSAVLAAPVILEGADTLLNEGVKVEVLDASAVGFSLLRRDYYTANAIVAMLGLGEYLEHWTEAKSDELLKNLLRPQVDSVWVERDAREEQVTLESLRVGDIVICGTGQMVPVDGVIVDGEAALNQSSITGESLPVHVRPGDDVLSGAVVEDGRIRISSTTVGCDTSMARIGRFLEQSLRTRSASQKRSDELADKLVPITFGLGLGLFALTRDVQRAASVLTVDYSCAIKVAAPIAVKSSMHAAGTSGVLLKGGQALDNLARVDTIVFDKTGTLTKGNLRVTDVIPLDGLAEEDLLALTAGAEEHYGHPVARAVVAEAKGRGLRLPPISQVDFIVAHGVSAYVEGERVLVGSRHFLEDDEQVDCSAASPMEPRLRKGGKSLLYVARQGRLLGVIAMRDELRPEAAQVMASLRSMGVGRVVMLTGDHKDTALAISEQLGGFDEVHYELKPDDKARIVKEMQEAGRFLAFTGDGVNDAPALISADVGICMPGGADLAREAAQVILLENDLGLLVTAREVAERNHRVMDNTFKAAVGINTVILALAATGRLSPVLSASLHNLSTLGILSYAAAHAGRSPRSETRETSA